MLFNSLDFGIFLVIVFILYWKVFQKSLRWQNFFLLVVSYVFYGWWDWRFLSLIFISSMVDYTAGIAMSSTDDKRRRKAWLILSLCVNFGMLAFFKYFNFFVDSFIDLFQLFGLNLNPRTLNIILPVGISFYTFQTVSYSIDVHRGDTEASRDPVAFFAFVSFFPQLVAGPIERAKQFLPQFLVPRKFDYNQVREGLRQMLWGLFKKVVIADNCGMLADEIFATYPDQSFIYLWLGAFYFSLQGVRRF
jgi:alginate O-acetyltransferase complex protein AlgI